MWENICQFCTFQVRDKYVEDFPNDALKILASRLISSLLEEPSTPSNPANESRLSSSKKSRKFRPRYWYVESTKAQKTKHGVRQTRRTDNREWI